MKPNPYKLRPYHNPEAVDESKVPDGWRFRYADEMEAKVSVAKFDSHFQWKFGSVEYGLNRKVTYIVPVAL